MPKISDNECLTVRFDTNKLKPTDYVLNNHKLLIKQRGKKFAAFSTLATRAQPSVHVTLIKMRFIPYHLLVKLLDY